VNQFRPSVVAVIDAGGANLGSVRYAIEREGATVDIIRDADGLRDARRVILPGVGAAPLAMKLLQERGLAEALRNLRVPLLGICLGMQLLFDDSEEGDVACLGLLPGRVRRLEAAGGVRVPHMGWNQLQVLRGDTLLQGIGDDAQAYFVHSYAAPVTKECIAACAHGNRFAAVVRRDNIMGAQFHPERSASAGAMLLRNFLAWKRA
jgi:imidazole glycerol-phosphate synthase subunit HisH